MDRISIDHERLHGLPALYPNMIIEVTIKLARWHWGKVRDAIDRANFEGAGIQVFEGKGILTRDFILRGAVTALASLDRTINEITGIGGRS